jgi:hypothetical protein
MGSLRKVIVIWSVLTMVFCTAAFIYSGTLPPDELVMANSIGFRVLFSVVVIGIPSLIGLFMYLFVGSLIRSLLRPDAAADSDSPTASRSTRQRPR